MTDLNNLDFLENFDFDGPDHKVHIRLHQRNSRKTITMIYGIDEKYDYNKLMKVFKREFACNGNVTNTNMYGHTIQLQGDHRDNVMDFLIDVGICNKSNIKIHG